jgi:hypothetical protein
MLLVPCGRHWQVWDAVQIEPDARVWQSLPDTHWTQLPAEHLGVLPWQDLHEVPQWLGVDMMSTQALLHRPSLVGQLLAQPMVPSVRQPNMHEVVIDALQLPEPLQRAAVVALEFVQLAPAPHEVVLPG